MKLETHRNNIKPKPKKWSRKLECPSCNVSTGSTHSKGCNLIYKKKTIK